MSEKRISSALSQIGLRLGQLGVSTTPLPGNIEDADAAFGWEDGRPVPKGRGKRLHRSLQQLGTVPSSTHQDTEELPTSLLTPPALPKRDSAQSDVEAVLKRAHLTRRTRRELEGLVGRRRPRVLRLPRWALAASLLIAASSVALATAYFRAKPILVTSAGASGGRVAEFQLHARLDFDAAGIPPEARILERCSFVVPQRGLGTAIIVELPQHRQKDVCGFGPHGELLWSARRDWQDWSALLAHPTAGFGAMKSLVTRRQDDRMEETVCVVLRGNFQSLVLLIDPLSGAKRGQCFYPGILGRGNVEVIGTLPEWSGEPRRILFGGQMGDAETNQAALLLLNTRGDVVQHLIFPSLGFIDPYTMRVQMIHTDWSSDRPEVTVSTWDSFYYSFLVRDGRLDLADAIATPGGGIVKEYERKNGEGSWKAMLEQRGGAPAYLRRVAASVKEEPFPILAGWRVK